MLDFKDSRVFDQEKTRFKKFLNDKLSTLEDEEARIEMEEGSTGDMLLDTETFLGGDDAFDFGSMDDMDFGSGDFGGGSGGTDRSQISNDRSFEQDNKLKTILFSPYFLFLYVAKLIIFDTPKKEEWQDIFKMLSKISLIIAITSVVLAIIDFKFIFSLPFQAVTSGIMFVISSLLLKYVFKEKAEGEGSSDGFGDFGGGDFGDFGSGDSDNSFGDFGGGDFGGDSFTFEEGNVGGSGSGLGFGNDDISSFGKIDDDNTFNQTEVMEFEGYTTDTSREGILKASPIDISSDEKFNSSLLQVFKENSKYQGTAIHNRKEIIESMSGYIVTNDKNFGKWDDIRKGSVEYNNLAYGIFKGLGQIVNTFLKDEERMIVLNMRSSPLLYRVEVELPSYFKQDAVQRKLHEIEDAIKSSDDDIDVEVFMSSFSGKFIFKLVRPNRNLISLGDILRFYDEDKKKTALDDFDNPKIGLPILVGLRNMEYPYFVDLEDNTSGVIVGGSGSGKSWLTFLLMMNFIFANDYNNVNFVILDKKNAYFWNQFAKFPHVLGYHTDHMEYLEILRELYQEIDRRKELLNELNAEDFKGLRKTYREKGEFEKLKEVPLLIIIVDEITSTMQNIKVDYGDEDKESYDEVRAIMSMITQEGRSIGVRLIAIGQRAIDNSVPKNVMANSSFKFAMKMDAESDFNIMMGKEVDKVSKPFSAGIGLSMVQGVSGIQTIKTLTPGGSSNSQIGKIIRVTALEWVRRSQGLDDIMNQPVGMNLVKTYNRDKYVQESYEDLEKGRILASNAVNEGFSAEDIGNNTSTMKSITNHNGLFDSNSSNESSINLTKLDENGFDMLGEDAEASELFDFDNFADTLKEFSDENSYDTTIDDKEEKVVDDIFKNLLGDLFESDSEADNESESENESDVAQDIMLDFGYNDDDEYELDFEDEEEEEEFRDERKKSEFMLGNGHILDLEKENTQEEKLNNTHINSNYTELDNDSEEDNPSYIPNNYKLTQDNDDDDDIVNSDFVLGILSENNNNSEEDFSTESIYDTDTEYQDTDLPYMKTEEKELPQSKNVQQQSFRNKNQFSQENDWEQEDTILTDSLNAQRNTQIKDLYDSDTTTSMATPKKVVKKVVKKRPTKKVVTQKRVSRKNGMSVDFVREEVPTKSSRFMPKESIREYIIQNGIKDGTANYKIRKEKLLLAYGDEIVEEAIDVLTILDDGRYFTTHI